MPPACKVLFKLAALVTRASRGIGRASALALAEAGGGVMSFLASDAARWITGDTLHVDGGSKL